MSDEHLGREALPAGHPLAWATLVAGTILDGLAWPGWGAPSNPVPELPTRREWLA